MLVTIEAVRRSSHEGYSGNNGSRVDRIRNMASQSGSMLHYDRYYFFRHGYCRVLEGVDL